MMKKYLLTLVVMVMATSNPAGATERHMMQPRVPADKLAEARALRSLLSNSSEAIEQGKALYHDKGTCFTCHGAEGDGKGPAGPKLNPAPRNFQHHGFWRHRTEGELFWAIKYGSPSRVRTTSSVDCRVFPHSTIVSWVFLHHIDTAYKCRTV